MTQTKTRSLTLSNDPVARLRELHELDHPASPEPASPANSEMPIDNTATQQPGNNALQQSSNIETQEYSNVETGQYSNKETQQPVNTAANKRSKVSIKQQSGLDFASENPVFQAMRQALRQPYSPNLDKGPMVATTTRIPSEIWERLDMASTLQDQTKQDLIAEALKLYLAKIGRGEM